MMTASYGSLAVARPRTVSRRDNCELATRHERAGSACEKQMSVFLLLMTMDLLVEMICRAEASSLNDVE